MMDDRERLHPFARAGLFQRGFPFVTAALLAVGLYASSVSGSWPGVLLGLGLVGSVVGSIRFLPWERLPEESQVLPLLWWVAGLAILTATYWVEDGMTRPLLLLPILWAAIYHKRSHLYLVVVVAAGLGIIGGQLLDRDVSWHVAAMPIAVLIPIAFTIQTFAEQVRRARRLSEAASLIDPLTGLGNRRRLLMELPRALQLAQRAQRPLSLMMIDLDHFKAYNDTHGHPAGDALLETVAQAWTQELRATDFLFRYGGEEFIALLPECDQSGARDVAERFMRSLPASQSCSIGIAVCLEDETPNDLIGRTDVAMYRAKRQGRAQFVLWDGSIDARGP